MHETAHCHFNLEWPAADARVRGPQILLGGWLVAKAGFHFSDVRARIGERIWEGLLGFPRADLAAHFKSDRRWLPAEFAIAAEVPDGPATITVEACDSGGVWQTIHTLTLVIAPDGEPAPGRPVRLAGQAAWRDTAPPFHGHLEDLFECSHRNNAPGVVHGWLKHDHQAITTVFASTDLRIFNRFDYDLSATLSPREAAAPPSICFVGSADLIGKTSCCLRVYAQLSDGSVHLVLAGRMTASSANIPFARAPGAQAATISSWLDSRRPLAALPSGRPRRLLIGVLNLHENDATLRALDMVRYLRQDRQWIAHIVSTVEGPLRTEFEAALAPVQIVDPASIYAASGRTQAETAIHQLTREVRWPHTDAAIIFDPLCFWLLPGAKTHGVPVIFDCNEETPLSLYFSGRLAASASTLVDEAWRVPQGVIYSSAFIAHHQRGVFPNAQQTHIPTWSTSSVPVIARNEARHQLAFPPDLNLAVSFCAPTPEQGGVTLLDAFTGRDRTWYFALARSTSDAELVRFTCEAEFNRANILVPPGEKSSLWLSAADACLNLAFARPALRPLLDAALANRPIVTTDLPSIREIFSERDALFVPAGDASSVAGTLAGLVTGASERTASAAERIRTHHNPGVWLPRYVSFFEAVVAKSTAGAVTGNHLPAGL